MNDTEKQKLNWLKIMTAGVIAMLVLLLVFTICMLGMVRTLRAYETRIDAVLTRAEIVSADLEALDTAGMVSAVNGISEQLRDADSATTLDSLQKTAKELEDIDWKDMSTTINEAAVQAKISLEQAEETMMPSWYCSSRDRSMRGW